MRVTISKITKMATMYFGLICLSMVLHACAITPEQFAERATTKIVSEGGLFFQWEYGSAIIMDAMASLPETFPDMPISLTPLLDNFLNKFKYDPKSNPYGYKLLNNIPIPFDKQIGDGIGLFPINYLTRAINNPHSNETESDIRIVNKVIQQYILAWPDYLNDTTIARKEWMGKSGQKASYVWADDQFMGLTLIARYAAVSDDPKLVTWAAERLVRFAQHLMDKEKYLFYHGYNDETKNVSCCKWGRANGWAMMATMEVLQALETVNDPAISILEEILQGFLELHAQAVIKMQSADGRWHQVLDEPSTYLETSCTAMFVSSMARAVLHGYLNDSNLVNITQVDYSIRAGWKGLLKTLAPDGSINGICMGTGIQSSVAGYESRGTPYVLSSPGLGAVLYAARDMHKYMEKYGHG